MEQKFNLVSYTILIALVLIIGTVSAQPGIPNHFYGSVTINGAPAPDGVLVEARVSGNYVAGTTTIGGTYGQESVFYVPNPGNMDGKVIEFYVQNVKAVEHTFNTNNPIVNLDLAVSIANFCGDGKCDSGESCSSCPADCGTCTTGGGTTGGGVVSGGTTQPETPEEPETCEEYWICTDWAECVNGKQSRTCADVNRCGTEENKPVESQDCEMGMICEPGQTMCRGDILMECSSDGSEWIDLQECGSGCSNGACQGFGITGLVGGLPGMVGIIIVIIIIAGLVYWKKR